VKLPTVRIVITHRDPGVTGWVVLLNSEVWASGLNEHHAHGHRSTLEFWAAPQARAAARERISGD
jgi:hypothetical protein